LRHAVDYAVAEAQGKAGFLPHDLVGIRVWTKTGAFTVILVPLRLWYRTIWKRRAMELKRYLRALGKRCIIAPASYLDRQPRLQNARLIAASRRAEISATDRIVLLAKVDEAIGLSLDQASSCIQAKDPAAAVLYLIAERALCINPDRAIGPNTVLSKRSH
jgi:hypothetical protein